MPSTAVPSSGDGGVCAAVALGWQMAQLFHSPVHEGPARDPDRGEQLPGRSYFPGATQSKWLSEQIQSQLKALLQPPPPVVQEAMANVLTALADSQRSRAATLDAIFTLHCRLLEALTVAHYRLGKGYSLGRAMAETALLPAIAATDEERKQQFQDMLSDRLITITDWLADPKTLLPDHTAYAASRSLHDWQQWAHEPRTPDDWAAAHSAIEVQGRIWRELLTGEKAARDILKLSDYHAAGRRVAKRVIFRFWWVIAVVTLFIAVVIFAGFSLYNIPPSVRLVGGIAWLAGALGITLKGTGALLGTGLKEVEGWLWNVELDGSVAVAATYLPRDAKPSQVSGSSLGQLSPEPKPGTQPQQTTMRRQTPKQAVD
jgi:hypothetical protein